MSIGLVDIQTLWACRPQGYLLTQVRLRKNGKKREFESNILVDIAVEGIICNFVELARAHMTLGVQSQKYRKTLDSCCHYFSRMYQE